MPLSLSMELRVRLSLPPGVYKFATNFNPEINLREVSAPGSYWDTDENGKGHWVEIPAMSIKRVYNFDQVGQKDMYLLHHEEIESLAQCRPLCRF